MFCLVAPQESTVSALVVVWLVVKMLVRREPVSPMVTDPVDTMLPAALMVNRVVAAVWNIRLPAVGEPPAPTAPVLRVMLPLTPPVSPAPPVPVVKDMAPEAPPVSVPSCAAPPVPVIKDTAPDAPP